MFPRSLLILATASSAGLAAVSSASVAHARQFEAWGHTFETNDNQTTPDFRQAPVQTPFVGEYDRGYGEHSRIDPPIDAGRR